MGVVYRGLTDGTVTFSKKYTHLQPGLREGAYTLHLPLLLIINSSQGTPRAEPNHKLEGMGAFSTSVYLLSQRAERGKRRHTSQ